MSTSVESRSNTEAFLRDSTVDVTPTNWAGVELGDGMSTWGESAQRRRRMLSLRGHEYSIYKTIKWATIGSAGALALILIGAAVESTVGYFEFLGPRVTADGTVLAPGVGSIESIDMNIKPVTLATEQTKVTGTKVGFSETFSALDGAVKIPNLNASTITRAGEAETDITLDPKKVKIVFDDMHDTLAFIVPDSALSTKVILNSSENTATTGSITKFTSDQASSIANALAGTFGGNAADVPLIGVAAKGTMDIENFMETIANDEIKDQVAKQCTTPIFKVPGVMNQFKVNEKDVSAVELLTSNIMSDPSLKLLDSKPLGEVKAMIKKATVVMSDHPDIQADTSSAEELSKLKSKDINISLGSKALVCSVTKHTKLILPKAGSN
jgi:hypothetical protein